MEKPTNEEPTPVLDYRHPRPEASNLSSYLGRLSVNGWLLTTFLGVFSIIFGPAVDHVAVIVGVGLVAAAHVGLVLGVAGMVRDGRKGPAIVGTSLNALYCLAVWTLLLPAVA